MKQKRTFPRLDCTFSRLPDTPENMTWGKKACISKRIGLSYSHNMLGDLRIQISPGTHDLEYICYMVNRGLIYGV